MMTVSEQNVAFYASTTIDFQLALGASGVIGVPVSNVTGSFTQAWNWVHTGQKLVFAVGRDALNALYYNPCNWPTPNGQPGGHTPFTLVPVPVSHVPAANQFANAAGIAAADTYKAATMLAYYAVHGQYPSGYGALPELLTPQSTCDARANANVSCPC